MPHDFSKFKAPYITLSEIHQAADRFRNRYWPDKPPPVKILDIVEFDLRLVIRPVKNLKQKADIDALLLGNRNTIIIDLDDFLDDRMQNRLAYSIAHEIGHLVLHEDLFINLNHSTANDWRVFIDSIPDDEYFWIEQHAYEFAGRLLVPPDHLKKIFLEYQSELEQKFSAGKKAGLELDLIADAALNFVSSSICKNFGVSKDVIQRRLKREKMWPPDFLED